MRDTPLCRRRHSALFARWRWQKCVCFSYTQREVFEDTLLEAYLRAEQFAKAETMLEERLMRRASVRDTFWLGRAQAGQGQSTQAQASFTAAAQGWCLGDATSSEMVALQRQYHA